MQKSMAVLTLALDCKSGFVGGIAKTFSFFRLDDSIITHLFKHYMGISEPSKADLQNITTILTKIHMVRQF